MYLVTRTVTPLWTGVGIISALNTLLARALVLEIRAERDLKALVHVSFFSLAATRVRLCYHFGFWVSRSSRALA
jgi:hypothetical protein